MECISPRDRVRHERARVAVLTRFRPADHPDLVEARRALAEARAELVEARRTDPMTQLDDSVRRVIAAFPPLSLEQRHKLAVLLLTPAVETAGGVPAGGDAA